jgi:hypothetical protein
MVKALSSMASRASGDHMAQLLYRPGQRRHLFAVRQLLQDPRDEDCYVAGPLAGVYSSSDPEDVRIEAARDSSVRPPYAAVHEHYIVSPSVCSPASLRKIPLDFGLTLRA